MDATHEAKRKDDLLLRIAEEIKADTGKLPSNLNEFVTNTLANRPEFATTQKQIHLLLFLITAELRGSVTLYRLPTIVESFYKLDPKAVQNEDNAEAGKKLLNRLRKTLADSKRADDEIEITIGRGKITLKPPMQLASAMPSGTGTAGTTDKEESNKKDLSSTERVKSEARSHVDDAVRIIEDAREALKQKGRLTDSQVAYFKEHHPRSVEEYHLRCIARDSRGTIELGFVRLALSLTVRVKLFRDGKGWIEQVEGLSHNNLYDAVKYIFAKRKDDWAGLLVVGDAGSGKSTLMRRLAFDARCALLKGETLPWSLCFLVEINNIPAEGILDWLKEKWRAESQLDPRIWDDHAGRILLLLDGADRIRERERLAKLTALANVINENQSDCFVISSRENWALNLLVDSSLGRVRIQPMQGPKIQDFLQVKIGKDASQVWSQLEKRPQAELEIYRSPFYAELLALKLSRMQSPIVVPPGGAELITWFIQMLLWDNQDSLFSRNLLTKPQKGSLSLEGFNLPDDSVLLRALLGLAQRMQQTQREQQAQQASIDYSVDSEDARTIIRKALENAEPTDIDEVLAAAIDVGLLIRKEDTRIEFRHQRFQEYFAARRLARDADLSRSLVAPDWRYRPSSDARSLEKVLENRRGAAGGFLDLTSLDSSTNWFSTLQLAAPMASPDSVKYIYVLAGGDPAKYSSAHAYIQSHPENEPPELPAVMWRSENSSTEFSKGNLILASECAALPEVERTVENDPDKKRLLEGLKKTFRNALTALMFDYDHADPRARIAAGYALSALDDPRFRAEDGKKYIVPELVRIAAGTYDIGPHMGAEKRHQTKASQAIFAEDYFIGRFPVTEAEFDMFIKDGGYEKEREEELWASCSSGEKTPESLEWLNEDEKTRRWKWWRYWADRPEDDMYPDWFTQQERAQLKKGRGLQGIARDNWAKEQPEPANQRFPGKYPLPGKSALPVVGVSWFAATAYCHWLTKMVGEEDGYYFRLPKEVEFEAAARGKSNREFCCSDSPESEFDPVRLNTWDNRIGRRTPLGALNNATPKPESAYDLSGNIWNWTTSNLTNVDDSLLSPDVDLVYSGQAACVLRGGSWGRFQNYASTTFHLPAPPAYTDDCIGFRVVKVRRAD